MTQDAHGFRTTRRQSMFLLGAAGLTSVVGLAAHAQDAPSGQIILGFSQEPTVFNPHLPHIEVDEGIHFAVFDTLFGIDPDGEFFPQLATEVPTVENGGISEDGMSWTIRLRDGVTWHDGQPFTAEDVKFTLELLVDPDFRSWRRTGHEQVRDITVVSPTELTFTLATPFAPYASILASTFIVPMHAFEGTDPNEAPFNNAPIGTGPFVWKQRTAGDLIELSANPDYFGEGPFIETLVVKYIPDLTVLYTQFKTGDIDVVGLQWITPDNYDEASKLADRTVEVVGTATFESITLNMARPQFQDLAVRQALYHALDKQSIIEALYYGVPSPTETYMPRESYFFNPDLPAHEYDPDKARTLLDDAGWIPGADGIREKDGVRLAFSNSTTAGNHLREQAQQFFQQSFLEIGVEMEIKNFPPAVMWADYWAMGEYDTVVVGMNTLTGSDPDTSDYFKSTATPAKGGVGQNTWGYANERVDALLEEGGSIVDPAKRLPLYREIQEIVREDLAILPLFQYATIRGYKVGVEGYQANINNRIDTWNVNTWRWS